MGEQVSGLGNVERSWPDRRPRLEVLRCPACGELHLSRSDECVLECDEAMEEVYVSRADDEYQGAVERVIADDEAMRRARHAYLNSAPHGTKHDDAARLEHMRAAFRAAFGGQ